MTNSNGIPENVTSYDSANKPFKHDVGRGKWATTWDFYAVALSHCFGFRHFTLHFLLFQANGFSLFFSYMLGIIIFILPLYFIQMFMGQFSSTGVISSFRIAPLFKGIGYVSLILNLMTTSYLTVMAAFPLLIIFESMQPYLPWSHCDNFYNSGICEVIEVGSLNATVLNKMENRFPINEYLDYMIQGKDFRQNFQFYFLWRIMLCAFLTWALIGLVLCNGVEMFGKILRFTTLTIFVCLILTTIRILCVKESWDALQKVFVLKFSSFIHIEYLFASPLLTLTVFGAGWGNVLTIASYNNFREDIGKLSLITCLTQMVVFLITVLNFSSVQNFLTSHFKFSYMRRLHQDTIKSVFVSYAFYFSHLSWSNLWTICFFLMIFLSQFAESALQVLTILTAIFDEYEYTRIYKKIILAIFIGVFSLISIFFCTNSGFSAIFAVYTIAGNYKLLIIFIELLVVVWVYGRLRFQRDVKFMTGKVLKSWKIWMMRFLTPLIVIFSFVLYCYLEIFYFEVYGATLINLIFILLKIIPLICIPFFMVYKVYSSTGGILDRLRKLCRPNDWYPADPIEHQNYENYLGNSDIADELVHDNVLMETTDVIHF